MKLLVAPESLATLLGRMRAFAASGIISHGTDSALTQGFVQRVQFRRAHFAACRVLSRGPRAATNRTRRNRAERVPPRGSRQKTYIPRLCATYHAAPGSERAAIGPRNHEIKDDFAAAWRRDAVAYKTKAHTAVISRTPAFRRTNPWFCTRQPGRARHVQRALSHALGLLPAAGPSSRKCTRGAARERVRGALV